ncbi:MAG: hypothetical protein AAGM29_13190, partial [Cyanobacteria bacterium J06588_4]
DLSNTNSLRDYWHIPQSISFLCMISLETTDQRSQQAPSFARLMPHRLRRRLAKLRFVRGVICDLQRC